MPAVLVTGRCCCCRPNTRFRNKALAGGGERHVANAGRSVAVHNLVTQPRRALLRTPSWRRLNAERNAAHLRQPKLCLDSNDVHNSEATPSWRSLELEMPSRTPALPLNPCQWEPAFYGTASASAHGWAAYRGSGPPRPKTIRHCNFCGSTTHLMRGSVLTRTSRSLRAVRVRAGYAYRPPARRTFLRRRAPRTVRTPFAYQPPVAPTPFAPAHTTGAAAPWDRALRASSSSCGAARLCLCPASSGASSCHSTARAPTLPSTTCARVALTWRLGT